MSSAAEHFSSLIRRVAEARDQTAFATLFDHFAPRLKSYLVRLGTDATEAEELAQEVMITLWRKAHLFDPGRASPSTWLFRIARNRRIDALRRDRSSEIDIDDPGLRPAAPDDADVLIDAPPCPTTRPTWCAALSSWAARTARSPRKPACRLARSSRASASPSPSCASASRTMPRSTPTDPPCHRLPAKLPTKRERAPAST
jgi:RNA polymerase sigma factor (sigma-70 family)